MQRTSSPKRLIKRGVYLYAFNPGYPIRVYKGNVYMENHYPSKTYFFKSNDKKKPYIVNCSNEMGVFIRNNFWLREINKEKALDIYYEHIKKAIGRKLEQIKSYKRTYLFFAKYDIENYVEEN